MANLDGFSAVQVAQVFAYLDELRQSGRASMFGAGAFLESEFGLERKEAREVLTGWMATFSREAPVEARSRTARRG